MKRLFSFFMIISLLAATVWVVGFICFIGEVPPQTMQTDNVKSKASLGVVLTGAQGRIMHGMIMLYEGRINKLFISGVDEDVPAQDLFTSAGGALGQQLYKRFKSQITLGKDAKSTRGNAIEVRKFITKDPRDKKLIIITTNYHIPRGIHEFHRVFPNYTLIAEPVFSPQFPAEWWRNKNSVYLMISEYHKFGISYVAKQIARETKLSEILANNPL